MSLFSLSQIFSIGCSLLICCKLVIALSGIRSSTWKYNNQFAVLILINVITLANNSYSKFKTLNQRAMLIVEILILMTYMELKGERF